MATAFLSNLKRNLKNETSFGKGDDHELEKAKNNFVKNQAPKITYTLPPLLLKQNHPATIPIKISGYPSPEVSWYIRDVLVQGCDDKFRVSTGPGRKSRPDETLSVLEISLVDDSLEGGVKIVATNQIGSDVFVVPLKTYRLLVKKQAENKYNSIKGQEMLRSYSCRIGNIVDNKCNVNFNKCNINRKINSFTFKPLHDNHNQKINIGHRMMNLNKNIFNKNIFNKNYNKNNNNNVNKYQAKNVDRGDDDNDDKFLNIKIYQAYNNVSKSYEDFRDGDGGGDDSYDDDDDDGDDDDDMHRWKIEMAKRNAMKSIDDIIDQIIIEEDDDDDDDDILKLKDEKSNKLKSIYNIETSTLEKPINTSKTEVPFCDEDLENPKLSFNSKKTEMEHCDLDLWYLCGVKLNILCERLLKDDVLNVQQQLQQRILQQMNPGNILRRYSFHNDDYIIKNSNNIVDDINHNGINNKNNDIINEKIKQELGLGLNSENKNSKISITHSYGKHENIAVEDHIVVKEIQQLLRSQRNVEKRDEDIKTLSKNVDKHLQNGNINGNNNNNIDVDDVSDLTQYSKCLDEMTELLENDLQISNDIAQHVEIKPQNNHQPLLIISNVVDATNKKVEKPPIPRKPNLKINKPAIPPKPKLSKSQQMDLLNKNSNNTAKNSFDDATISPPQQSLPSPKPSTFSQVTTPTNNRSTIKLNNNINNDNNVISTTASAKIISENNFTPSLVSSSSSSSSPPPPPSSSLSLSSLPLFNINSFSTPLRTSTPKLSTTSTTTTPNTVRKMLNKEYQLVTMTTREEIVVIKSSGQHTSNIVAIGNDDLSKQNATNKEDKDLNDAEKLFKLLRQSCGKIYKVGAAEYASRGGSNDSGNDDEKDEKNVRIKKGRKINFNVKNYELKK